MPPRDASQRKIVLFIGRGMTLVKQTSLELGGCQTHMKARSISPTCVKPLIDEVGERERLASFQMALHQDPLAATAQQPHTSATQ